MNQKLNDTPQHTQQGNGQAPAGMTFAIQRIYIKDISFETPNTPAIFRETWQPNVNLEVNIQTQKLDETIFEVVLFVTVTVKSNEKIAFLAEVKQAGIFIIDGFEERQLSHMLGSYCPSILFPYAREMVSNLVIRGGFPPLYLAPMNFDMLYEQQLQAQQKPQATSSQPPVENA